MTDVTGREDPDLAQDHVTEIVTGIVKDVDPDLEIVKIVGTDPDLDHEKGIIADLEKMNLAKDVEEIERNEKIVTEKKRIKEARIQCLLKKLTKCVPHLVYLL